ncbi:hypothetical protein [Solibacillus sp. FSL H8-0538]|uniref:hypothetical protein n=1 Tax=Solibacillus sp. FSL H8-0538 TaxID=2921400 RepID=UPI0030F908DE
MKKILTIATFTLGLSVVAGSVLAASNNDMWESTKSSESVNLEEMAKEKGVPLDELIVQLEKEEKLTEVAEPTSSTETAQDSTSSEPVNLEEMAKEKGVTLDELIAQLEKEGKLTKAAELTEAKQVETNNK